MTFEPWTLVGVVHRLVLSGIVVLTATISSNGAKSTDDRLVRERHATNEARLCHTLV